MSIRGLKIYEKDSDYSKALVAQKTYTGNNIMLYIQFVISILQQICKRYSLKIFDISKYYLKEINF